MLSGLARLKSNGMTESEIMIQNLELEAPGPIRRTMEDIQREIRLKLKGKLKTYVKKKPFQDYQVNTSIHKLTYHFTRNTSGLTFTEEDDEELLYAEATAQILKTDLGMPRRLEHASSSVLKSTLTNIAEVTEMESPTAESSNLATENLLDDEEPENLLLLEALNNDEDLDPHTYQKVAISSNVLFKTLDAKLRA